ncbi:competence protein [Flavobacterium sp. CYK-4]|uniref:competence protein n=1 Tax=Flavobacterium lotistagni TaxID=2709660 RepID=UPI0014090E50|nr:competence protein [Flavobacterium lotistagni]NHM06124.1 competence protein [Flavobacterium lotistagni]
MAFEELKENTEDLQQRAQAFIDSSVAYYKLWGFKVAMKSSTLVLKFILILLGLSMVLLFGSFAAAFAIGQSLGNYALGFLIVAGIYALFIGLLFLIKDKIVEGRIMERFSEIFFND